jgi:O-methyltransferase
MKNLSPESIVPMDEEPWVYLANAGTLSRWEKRDEIYANQRLRQTLKYEFFRLAFDFINDSEITGDYLEFGVHRARTFRMALTAARLQNMTDMEFHAFDSFSGLPDVGVTVIEKWRPGSLKTSHDEFMKLINEHGLFLDKIYTHIGYFSSYLNRKFCSDFSTRDGGRKAAMVTVDCDLYESSVPVFDFLPDVLQHGTVIYLDDVFAGYKTNNRGGMLRAFEEMSSKKLKFKFIPYLHVGWWGRSYIASAY